MHRNKTDNMNLEKVFLIIFTLLIAMGVVSFGFDLLTEASTIANVIGVILILVTLYVTIKTKCLTTLIKNKDEKN